MTFFQKEELWVGRVRWPDLLQVISWWTCKFSHFPCYKGPKRNLDQERHFVSTWELYGASIFDTTFSISVLSQVLAQGRSVWVLVGSFLHSCQNWEWPMCSSTELLGEELSYLWNLSECFLESCSGFVQLFCHLENMKVDMLHVWRYLIRPACKSFVRARLHIHPNAFWGSVRKSWQF